MGQAGRELASGDGLRLQGRRDPRPRADLGDAAGRADEPESRTEPRTLQAAERGRAAVSTTQGCRRIFTRFDKLDAMFLNFAVVVETIYDLA